MKAKYFWPNRSFAVVDTETTGLDFFNDRVIQLAVAVFANSQNIWNFEWYSNVSKPSALEAVAVHNISDEWRWANGINPREIANHFLIMMNRLKERNCPVVAFNAPFDFGMMRQEFKRFNMNLNTDGLYVIDPLVIDRHFERNVPVFTSPYMRLGQMAARYGCSQPTHNALEDAKVTGYVACAQSIHHSSIRNVSIRDLHERQTVWYGEFRKKVEDFARKKDLQFAVPDWPWGDINVA